MFWRMRDRNQEQTRHKNADPCPNDESGTVAVHQRPINLLSATLAFPNPTPRPFIQATTSHTISNQP